MDALSVRNDLPTFPLDILPLVLVVVCVLVVLTGRDRANEFLVRGCSDRAFWITVALSSVLLALFFLILEPHVTPWGGLDRYFVRAINIVKYGVYGYEELPTAIFPPGYSFLLLPLLLVLGETRWVFFITNLALLIAFVLFVRTGLRRLGAGTGMANLFALAVFLYPNRLFSILLPFSDVPFSLLYGAAFLALLLRIEHRDGIRSAIAIGILGGAAALVRSNGLVTFVPLLLGILASGPRGKGIPLRECVAAAAVFLLILIPWTIRNYTTFGRLVPVSLNAGINIAIGNNPSGPTTHNTYIDSVWNQKGAWEQVNGVQWNEAQKDSFFSALGRAYIMDHPADFVGRAFRKLAITFEGDVYAFGELNTYTNAGLAGYSVARVNNLPPWLGGILGATIGAVLSILIVLNNTFYYLLVIGSLVVFFTIGRSPNVLRWILVLLLGGVVAMIVVTFGLSRYKEPMVIVGTLYVMVQYIWMNSQIQNRPPSPSSSEPLLPSPSPTQDRSY